MAMAIPSFHLPAPGSSCLSAALTQSGALHKITTEKPDLEYLYFDEQELDENTAAELERIWRMDANGDYITVFKNIWSELEDNA